MLQAPFSCVAGAFFQFDSILLFSEDIKSQAQVDRGGSLVFKHGLRELLRGPELQTLKFLSNQQNSLMMKFFQETLQPRGSLETRKWWLWHHEAVGKSLSPLL